MVHFTTYRLTAVFVSLMSAAAFSTAPKPAFTPPSCTNPSGPVAIVIGAGPAGLATSLGLATVCCKVILVEKYPAFEPRGATIGVMMNGRKALTELCPSLWSELEERGIPMKPKEPLSTMRNGIMLPWWELRDAAARAVERVSNIELRMGESFTEIHDTEDDDRKEGREGWGNSIRVRFESGLELCGDFLVGSDGVHSRMRESLGLPPPIATGETVYRGFLTVTDECSPQLRDILEKSALPFYGSELRGVFFAVFNFNEKYPGRLIWVLSTKKEVKQGGTTTLMSLLLDAGLSAENVPLIEEMFRLSNPSSQQPYPPKKVVDLSDEAVRAHGWGGRGHVTLVGDAAHAMPPADGQGGNQAFEDAVVLTRCLRKAVATETKTANKEGSTTAPAPASAASAAAAAATVAGALREFESLRLGRVKRVHDDQRLRTEARLKGEGLEPHSAEFVEWLLNGV